MNADGSNPKRLTNNTAWDSGPAWSPDGKNMAFYTDRAGGGEIFVMNADGSNPYNLTNYPGLDGSPAWSPDGKLIAFSSNRGDNLDIYSMNIDGSDVRRLTDNPKLDDDPAWQLYTVRLPHPAQPVGRQPGELPAFTERCFFIP